MQDGVVYSGDPDSIMMEGGEDKFVIPDQGVGTKGTLRKDGSIDFFEGYNLTKPPWGHRPEAGGAPTLDTPGWSDSGKLPHYLSTKYKCCCSPFEKTTVDALPW